MAYIANPYVLEAPLTTKGGRLGRMARARRGRWALITDGEIEVVAEPTQEQVDAADTAIRGGYDNPVTDEVANLLIEAGYSHWVTEVD